RGGDMIWAEGDPNVLIRPREFIEGATDRLGTIRSPRLPVAAAVKDQKGTPRLMVAGDATYLSNYHMARPDNYYHFVRSSMDWLSEREVPVMGIKPKETTSWELPYTEVKHPERMIWLPLGLSLGLIVGLGAAVYVVRRR